MLISLREACCIVGLCEGCALQVTSHKEGFSDSATTSGSIDFTSPSFRLFATVTTPRARTPTAAAVARSVYRPASWQLVEVRPAGSGDLAKIVATRFPSLQHVAHDMVRTLRKLVHEPAADDDDAAAAGPARGQKCHY